MNNWIITSTAREHWFSGPLATADNVPGVQEFTHSLSMINRYTGHTSRPYSVAEHSLLVYWLAVAAGADTTLQLAALMHDAHECITGDCTSPVKREIGQPWSAFEGPQQERLLTHYDLLGVSRSHQYAIRQWDLEALATERRDLLPFNPALHTAWPIIDTPGNEVLPVGVDLNQQWRERSPWMYWRDRMAFEVNVLMEQRLQEQQKAVAA